MIDRSAYLIFAIVAVTGGASAANAAQEGQACKPQYVGTLVLAPDANGRSMTLHESYGFKDKNCHTWQVPKGAAVDGASIPRWAWSIIGGPWEGAYRNASVVHDWFCAVRTRPWKSVHQMFFDGMIASGVGRKKAKIMYLAVYYGGPRWDDLAIRNSRLLSANMKRVDPEIFKALSSAHFSLANGQVVDAEAKLAAVKTEMRTNGDQFAVASLARSIAVSKNDKTSATAAIDAMIFSGVPDTQALGKLQIDRATLAYEQGDLATAAQNARSALGASFNEDAVQILAALKRQGSESVDGSADPTGKFEPTELEFQRLANIVEKDDLTPDQIEKLVDEVREPPRE